MEQQNDKNKFSYLQTMYNDTRQEIRQRIAQRDTLGIQMFIAIGVFIVAGFSNHRFSPIAFLLPPFIVWYYVQQISSSYNIHERLCKFLRGSFADEYMAASGYSSYENAALIYWEKFGNCFEKQRGTGIRKKLLTLPLFIVPVLSELLFLATARQRIFETGNSLSDGLLVGAIMLAAMTVYVFLIYHFFRTKRAYKKELETFDPAKKSPLK